MIAQFKNQDKARIHSTGTELDGKQVMVVGLASTAYPASGSIYVVQGDQQINGWNTLCITDSCLMPV